MLQEQHTGQRPDDRTLHLQNLPRIGWAWRTTTFPRLMPAAITRRRSLKVNDANGWLTVAPPVDQFTLITCRE